MTVTVNEPSITSPRVRHTYFNVKAVRVLAAGWTVIDDKGVQTIQVDTPFEVEVSSCM